MEAEFFTSKFVRNRRPSKDGLPARPKSGWSLTGFTLLEILVSMAIFLIIAGAMFGILGGTRKAFDMGSTQVEVEQEVRRALDYMSKELRQAGANKISGLSEGGSASSVTFEIPYDVDGDGDVINGLGGIEWSNDAGVNRIGTITYSLSGGRILRALSLGGEFVLANNASAINFSWPIGTDIITIAVTGEKYPFKGFTSPGDEKVSIALNSQVRMRN